MKWMIYTHTCFPRFFTSFSYTHFPVVTVDLDKNMRIRKTMNEVGMAGPTCAQTWQDMQGLSRPMLAFLDEKLHVIPACRGRRYNQL